MLIYSVRGEVTSFLISTSHIVDLASLQNPVYQRTIAKCSVLFTEMGMRKHLNSRNGCFPGTVQYSMPYPYNLDSFLTMTAWCHKIPVESLDHGVPEMKKEIAAYDSMRQKLGADAYDDYELLRLGFEQRQEDPHAIVQIFKQGCLRGLQKERNATLLGPKGDILITKREEKWAEILVPKLLTGNQSIAIAVGAVHLLGLTDRFEKAGLKVERISSPSHL